MKVGFISLGCDKNRVDTERMIFNLSEAGATIVDDASEADVMIVNTCAFIESAKKEAIENILDMADLKKTSLKKLVVTGCFATRYGEQVSGELPEVDAFVNIKDEKEIVNVVFGLFNQTTDYCYREGRIVTTPAHYAYLRIADGCNNRCSYCAIPAIRGKYVSEPLEKLVAEAQRLRAEGVRELILVAQDVTSYGKDVYGKPSLKKLLEELVKIDFWKIRLLYTYPELIDDELLDFIEKTPRMAKYLDIPMQHINSEILKKMARRGTSESVRALVKKIRSLNAYIAVRSTFIVGFPGETDEQNAELVDFVKDNFDYAGFFEYSPEEGTRAYEFDGRVKKSIMKKRRLACEKAQASATINRHERLVGETVEVIYEGIDYRKGKFYGRTEYQAPDIDVNVYFTADFPLEIGCVYNVKINKSGFYPEGTAIDEALKE